MVEQRAPEARSAVRDDEVRPDVAVTPPARSAGRVLASPWLGLGLVLVGSYVVTLNNTVMGVALPSVASDLGTARLDVDWVVTSFLLGVVVVQPATGWMADRWGRRPVYVSSLGVFAVGSVACAVAPGMEALVAARFVQGIGGGALLPVGMTIIYELFPPHRRGTALGVWGVGIAAAPAAGPPLGGWVVTELGWRWLFAALFVVAVTAAGPAVALLQDVGFREARQLDVVGWVLAGIAVVAVVVVARQAPSWGFTSIPTILGALVGGAAIVLFLRRSFGRDDAIVDLEMFSWPAFTVVILVTAPLALTQFARLNFLPVELQVVRGLDAQEVGLLLAPAAVGVAGAMPLAGWLVDRVGTRVPALLGFGIVASTMWVLGHLEPSMPESRIVMVLVIQGVGTGFAYVPTTVGAMNAVPDRYAAQASAVQNLDRQLAGAIGIAMLGALLVSDLGAVAPSGIDRDAAQAAYNKTFILAFWVAVVGGALSIFLPSDRRREALIPDQP